jgi:predicted SAM-dependent methyltransferase
MKDFINVDIRATPAADLVMDLNHIGIGPNKVDCLFGSAFFEHLYRTRRIKHLCAARRSLKASGFMCYLAIPNFRSIARFYLEGAPGIVGPKFDLFNVYRYTHGNPEGAEDWLSQLHKSLFDEDEVETLLKEAGFKSFVVFTYAYPNEELPVNLGFYATPQRLSETEIKDACTEFLRPFDQKKIQLSTLTVERIHVPRHIL